MPKTHYALAPIAPKRLELSCVDNHRDFSVKFDHQLKLAGAADRS